MKLTNKKINVNYDASLFVKNKYESKRMFATKVASILLKCMGKNNKLNIDSLQKKINDDVIVKMILRKLSFEIEKYHANPSIKREIIIFTSDKKKLNEIIKTINILAYVRYLQDMPQNILTPNNYYDLLRNDFKEKLSQPQNTDLQKMNLFNAIGNSSNNKQKFAIIRNNISKNSESDPIILVGKGITYDSGGYNLKSGKNLLGMKADMSGSAVVAGVMKLLKEFKISKNVIAILPLANNDLSINSIQPQMIIKSYNETYVEIKNTDAEGRLVNADAISYANKKFNPKIIIEVSTLTGSITTTLDNLSSGLFSNNDKLGKEFIKKTKNSGEKLTLFDRYFEVRERLYASSDVADIANVDGKMKMNSQYAFEFLNHFAEKTPFIHLDIAGTAVFDRKRGTAETTMTIFEYIKNI